MDEITPHGFKLPDASKLRAARRAGFVLGAKGGVQGEVINPSGDWTAVWPKDEKQSATEGGRFFETNSCTVYGTENAVEALMRFKFNNEYNYSERALAIYGGVNPKSGADPHTIADKAGELGFVLDRLLPFDESIDTVEKFYSPNPLPLQVIQSGASWKFAHRFNFEIVFDPSDKFTPAEKQERLKEALKKGTVCVSVYAWRKNSKGLYTKQISGQNDNHWTGLKRYDEGKYPICGDSYDPFEKKLAENYNFDYAMIYYIDAAVVEPIGKLQQLLNALKELVAALMKKAPAPKPPMPDLYQYAKSLIGTDASPKDLARDGLGCAESVSTILRKLFPAFPVVTGTWSLYDALRNSSVFEMFPNNATPQPGDIILCVTGQGRGSVSNGHAGIVGEGSTIMSNDSKTGKWLANFTISSWRSYYGEKGKYPIYLFRQRS